MCSCICVRGSTLAELDTVLVLLFEGRTSCSMATSGEPSTWFPLEQLVEQELEKLEKYFIFQNFQEFQNFHQKSNIFKNFKPIELFRSIVSSTFY